MIIIILEFKIELNILIIIGDLIYMSNTYLKFISDEDLIKCIETLHKTYLKVNEEVDLKDFYKNKVDPIRFLFDKTFNKLDDRAIINNEISRQKEKTIGNAIGTFHENLLGCIDGVTKMPVGSGYDIKKDDGTLFAEIKNKHNTVKGEDKKSIHNKLLETSKAHFNVTCYYVNVIAKKSCNETWVFTSKGKKYNDKRVKIISIDKFYQILTNDKNAFKELCEALPIAINEYMRGLEREKNTNSSTVYNELEKEANKNKISILEQMFNDTFNGYNGF